MAQETEKASWPGRVYSRCRVTDVFPAPEGAAMMISLCWAAVIAMGAKIAINRLQQVIKKAAFSEGSPFLRRKCIIQSQYRSGPKAWVLFSGARIVLHTDCAEVP